MPFSKLAGLAMDCRVLPWLDFCGALRRDLDPDMEEEVEVLDLMNDEARALLLSIDPLAALAQTQTQL
jgi:hypothetical protein